MDGAPEEPPVTRTIYGADRYAVEAFYPHRPSDVLWGGANFGYWEQNKDVAIFVHIPGDGLDNNQALRYFGKSLAELDETSKNESVSFCENSSLPNPSLCVVAADMAALSDALASDSPLAERLESFWYTEGVPFEETLGFKTVETDSELAVYKYSAAELAWCRDPKQAAIVIRDNNLIAKHRVDGREIELVMIEITEVDHQDEGGGYEVFLDAENVFGPSLQYAQPVIKFHEIRNPNYGGETGVNLGSGNPWHKHYPGDEKPRFRISHVSLTTAVVEFTDGTEISTAGRGGDWNNTFTRESYSFSGSDNWFSNPDTSYIYSDGTDIIAIHMETGEKVSLVRIEDEWLPDSPGSRQGKVRFMLTDISGGRVLGGFMEAGFRNISRPDGGNRILASYRFDGKSVETVDVDYEPGNRPVVYAAMTLDNAEQRMDSGTEGGTIVFRDGNVLVVHEQPPELQE